ncbi:MAG: hypothetical protein ACC635_04220, partial [Acidiferrobacterales bacterium]
MQWLTHSFNNRRLANSLTLFTPLLILIIPVSGLPVFYYIRGFTGDLSIITAVLLSSVIGNQFFRFRIFDKESAEYFYAVLFVVGTIFYITSLGYGQFDPYGLAYGSLIIPVGLLAVMALLLWKNKIWIIILLSIPLFAYYLGILESNNIWDYLIDPFLWLYATGRTFKY